MTSRAAWGRIGRTRDCCWAQRAAVRGLPSPSLKANRRSLLVECTCGKMGTMYIRCWVLSALLCVTWWPRDARAQASTCEPQKVVCCTAWVAQITVDGRSSGLIREDSYEELTRAIEKHRRWEKRFCRFFGPQSDSCRSQVEAPMCRPDPRTKLLPRGVEDAFGEVIDGAAETIRNSTNRHGRIRRRIARIARAFEPFITPEHESKNPFAHAGLTLDEYRESLERGLQQLQRLRETFRTIVEPQLAQVEADINRLWQDNGSFADSGAVRRRRFDFGGQIADLMEQLPEEPQVADPPTVALDRDYTVVKTTPAPPVFVVAVGEHAMKHGFKLVRGEYPLGAISIDKQGVFAQPVVAVKSGDSLRLIVQNGAATVELKMIPDIDGDGVLDATDHCKDTPGPEHLGGCPDADGDSVVDLKDRCPRLAGNAPTGCPTPKKCNSHTQAGLNAPERHVVSVGKGSGTVDLHWSMVSIHDQIQVFYEGQLLHDTGCVNGAGHVSLSFTGHSGLMEVSVLPSCLGDINDTQWEFSLGCAR